MMYDYVITKPPLDEDTLAHYGVLGMKWGVRKNPAKAYARAMAKSEKLKKRAGITSQRRLARINRKAAKANVKAAKATKKYLKKLNNPFISTSKLSELSVKKDKMQAKAMAKQAKADKMTKKSAQATKRQVKWDRAVNKTFKDFDVNKLKNGSNNEETLSNRKVQKIKKDYETKSKTDKSRYQTMTIKTKKGQDDYTIDTKYNAIVSKSSRDKKGNTLSKQRMSDSDIAISKKTISELRSKQNKQWNRDFNKDFKELESLVKQQESKKNKNSGSKWDSMTDAQKQAQLKKDLANEDKYFAKREAELRKKYPPGSNPYYKKKKK